MGFQKGPKNLKPRSAKWMQEQLEGDTDKFWVCDIETRNWTEFVCIMLTDGENVWDFSVTKEGLKKWGAKEAGRRALAAFFEFLFADKKNKKIFAHFGGKFDFLFLLNHLFLESNYSIEGMIPRGSGLLCFEAVEFHGTDAESLKKLPPKKRKRFEETGSVGETKLAFWDSSAMLPFSLKSLTTNFKVETMKQEWDHSKTLPYATPELLEYCRADCLGLWQVIWKYYNWPIIKKAGSSPTIAGQALKVLQTFLDEEIYCVGSQVDLFVRGAYFGGRTEIFKPLYKGGKGKLNCFDVNSLYPTVMRLHEYPSKFKHFTWEYEPNAIGFYDAEVEVPEDMYVPPLGVVWQIDGQKKFIFPTGRFKGRWSTAELEYAKSLGVKVLWTGKGAIFHSGGMFFKKYVDTLYEIRETSERESVDNVLAKLLLNSCYGRFGLKVDREGLVVDQGQEGVHLFTTIGEKDRLVRLMTEPKKLDTFNNVSVAAWVTSQARIYMHKIYMRDPESLYYTDTDSLFTTDSYPDEKGLGGLKLEYACAAACFLLPKTYVAEGIEGKKPKKVTMKGFDRKKTAHFTVDDFLTALEGDLRILRVVQEPKFATFKTAIKNQKKLLTMLPESPREIRSMYDKRIVFKRRDGAYDTRPHHITNNEPIVYRGE